MGTENGLSTEARQAVQRNILLQGLSALHVNADKRLCDTLLEYSALLQKWNRSYNLTAINTPEKILTDHFLDSLSVHPYLHGSAFLDAGTGAGFPGLVLALFNPAEKWVLLDSNMKKIRFVTQVCISLGVNNVEVAHARVEKYRRNQGFDVIISRAFGSVLNFYRQSQHLLSEQGRLLAMKAGNCQTEITALEKAELEYQVHSLFVPGLNKDRCLIEILPSRKNHIAACLSL